MSFLNSIVNHGYKLILRNGSSERRIRYLREQGVKIGNNCLVDTLEFSTEPFLIEIGDHVAISSGTVFSTHEGAVWCFREEVDGAIFGRIIIGNNVFVGVNCTILLNTTIGNNCIVGAGSVVRGKFPDNSVIFGNPAKVILSMSLQKTLFKQNHGLMKTKNLSVSEIHNSIKNHFEIQ